MWPLDFYLSISNMVCMLVINKPLVQCGTGDFHVLFGAMVQSSSFSKNSNLFIFMLHHNLKL